MKATEIYLFKKTKEMFDFPIGCVLEIHATDEPDDMRLMLEDAIQNTRPIIIIGKAEEKEV